MTLIISMKDLWILPLAGKFKLAGKIQKGTNTLAYFWSKIFLNTVNKSCLWGFNPQIVN
jgi:hypothetical protein